jgi:uncharacterized protein
LKILFNPVGIKCNLNCNYCFHRYKNHSFSNYISLNTAEIFISEYINTFPDMKEYEFIWHGGEPLLAGTKLIEKIIRLQQKHLPNKRTFSNGLQTNGTLLNKSNVKFLKEFDIKLGVSYDGPFNCQDKFRKFKNGKGTYSKIIKAFDLLNEYDLEFGTVLVINSFNKDYAEEIFDDIIKKGIKSIRLSPCIEYHNNVIEPYSLKKLEFANFVIKIFDLWWDYDEPSIEIGYVTDIIEGFRFGETTSCILNTDCQNFLIFDYNGDVKSCEDIFGTHNIFGNIHSLKLSKIIAKNNFYYKFFNKINSIRKKNCKDCKWFSICKGGCPYLWEIKSNKPLLCEDNKKIFAYISNKLIAEINNFSKTIKK